MVRKTSIRAAAVAGILLAPVSAARETDSGAAGSSNPAGLITEVPGNPRRQLHLPGCSTGSHR